MMLFDESQKSRRLVVVLGPHRSGTSLCTAAINFLGGDLGFSINYKSDENKKGFFEHPQIVSLNESILSFLGASWDSPSFFWKDKASDVNLESFKMEACELIRNTFNESLVAVVKDPRFCQLLPFWLDVFNESGYDDDDIYIINIVRNPIEVALSQSIRAKRNPVFYEYGRTLEEGVSLWLSLTIQSLQYSQGYANLFVSYQSLIDSPKAEIEMLAEFIGVKVDVKPLSIFISDFIDASLHRSKPAQSVVEGLKKSFPQAFDIFDLLVNSKVTDRETLFDTVMSIFYNDDTQVNFYRSQASAIPRLASRCRKQSELDMLRESEFHNLKNQVFELKRELEKQCYLYQSELKKQADSYKEEIKVQSECFNVEIDKLRHALKS